METYSQDPRTIVTHDAFSVDPPLLGTPLAPPRRRAVALLINLILVGLITAFFFTSAGKLGRGDRMSKVFRLFLGCMGLTVLLGTATIFLGLRFLNDRPDNDPAITAFLTSMDDSVQTDLSNLSGRLGGVARWSRGRGPAHLVGVTRGGRSLGY